MNSRSPNFTSAIHQPKSGEPGSKSTALGEIETAARKVLADELGADYGDPSSIALRGGVVRREPGTPEGGHGLRLGYYSRLQADLRSRRYVLPGAYQLRRLPYGDLLRLPVALRDNSTTSSSSDSSQTDLPPESSQYGTLSRELPLGPSMAHPSHRLPQEVGGAPSGVGAALAQPGHQHVAGSGGHGQQRVILACQPWCRAPSLASP